MTKAFDTVPGWVRAPCWLESWEAINTKLLDSGGVGVRALKTPALFEAFAPAFVLIAIWFVAFLNGGTITLRINAYGKVWAEYVLWRVLTPVLVLGGHYLVTNL